MPDVRFLTLGRSDVVRHSLVQKIVEAYEKSFDEEDYNGVGRRFDRFSQAEAGQDGDAEKNDAAPESPEGGSRSQKGI